MKTNGVFNMDVKLVKWGHSQGIRLPKVIVQQLNLKLNDRLDMEVKNGQIILQKEEHDLFDDMFKDFDVEKYFIEHGSLEENFGGNFGRENF